VVPPRDTSKGSTDTPKEATLTTRDVRTPNTLMWGVCQLSLSLLGSPLVLTPCCSNYIHMTCRNLCERLYSKTVVGKSNYHGGKKYCRRCEVYFLHDGFFCPCCGMRLRVSPVNKREVQTRRDTRFSTIRTNTQADLNV
jgi:hypothetical protein